MMWTVKASFSSCWSYHRCHRALFAHVTDCVPADCRNPEYDALCIRVIDEDLQRDGEDLGVAVLGLGALVRHPGKEFHFKLPLRGALSSAKPGVSDFARSATGVRGL
jgi:hypothetical protein